MHGHVGVAFRHRVLELLHEEALAAHGCEGYVEAAVAFGRYPEYLGAQVRIQWREAMTIFAGGRGRPAAVTIGFCLLAKPTFPPAAVILSPTADHLRAYP